MFWYAFREREMILDLFEYSTGQRMHTRYFQVGGVIEDIPVGWAEKGARVLRGSCRVASTSTATCSTRTRSWLHRMRNVCPLGAPTSCASSASPGPLLRAAGDPWDLRKAMPYCGYEQFDFKIPVGTEGDNYDRFAVRMQEMKESDEDHPPGPRRPAGGSLRSSTTARSSLPAASRARHLDGGADPPLQARHRGLPGPRGRGLLPDRGAARGARLLRARRRLEQAGARAHARPVVREPAGDRTPMVKDSYIADLIATLAMMDPILGGIDR